MKKKKKNNKNKNKQINKNLLWLVLLLCFIGLGIGYAILTEQLTINNTVSYDAMKWDISYTTEEVDLTDVVATMDSYIIGDVTFSNDMKTIYFTCNLGEQTAETTCVGGFAGINNSTFDAVVTDVGMAPMDSDTESLFTQYVKNGPNVVWYSGENDGETLAVGDIVKAGEEYQFIIETTLNEFDEGMLSEEGISFEFIINVKYEQYSE